MELRRSPRKGKFESLLFFALTPYRCRWCSCRQLKFSTVAIALPADVEVAGPSPLLRLREPVLRAVMVLGSVELALQIAALAVWLEYRPSAALQFDSERTVMCVGDSYTFGFGARRDSYPAALEKLLKQDGGSWRVVNAGWPGQNSRDAALTLQYRLGNVHPSLVYIMVGSDDGWSHPSRLDSRRTVKGSLHFPWRWRTVRLAALLVSASPSVAAIAPERIDSWWRSVKYRKAGPSGTSLVGDWSFQGQILHFQADHVLRMGNREFEWKNRGNRMEVSARDGWSSPTVQYVWEMRDGRLFVTGGQFRKGVFLDRLKETRTAMPATAFPSEEPRPDSTSGATLAAHLQWMTDLARGARSEVVLMSYPFHGRGDLNSVVRRVASESEVGWIDVDAAFAERLETTRVQDLYLSGGRLNDRGFAFLADLVAADVRQRSHQRSGEFRRAHR